MKDKLYIYEQKYSCSAVTLLFQEGYLTIKAIKYKQAYLGIANKNVAKLLAAFELNKSGYSCSAVTLLFQEGYLTIKAIKYKQAYLGIANKNVAKLLAAFELNKSGKVGQEE